jgi:hypothetical protein
MSSLIPHTFLSNCKPTRCVIFTPCNFKNFWIFLSDSPMKYNCKVEATISGVACILSNPRLIVKYLLQSLQLNFCISPYLLCLKPSFTIQGDLQYMHKSISTGLIRATSTSLCNAKEISTAKMCLHLTPRYLWSGHE